MEDVPTKLSYACTLRFLVQDNAYLATCHDACFLLLSLLDPREKCSSIQVLTTKVMVKIVHVLHNTPDEVQVSVDKGVILVGFLNMMSPRYHEDGLIPPCVRMIISLLGVFPLSPSPLSLSLSLPLSLSLSFNPPFLLFSNFFFGF